MDRDKNNKCRAIKRDKDQRHPGETKREITTLTEREKDDIYIKRMLLKAKLYKK